MRRRGPTVPAGAEAGAVPIELTWNWWAWIDPTAQPPAWWTKPGDDRWEAAAQWRAANAHGRYNRALAAWSASVGLSIPEARRAVDAAREGITP